MSGAGCPLQETVVRAKLAGLASVSDVALLHRLRDAEPWLLAMCRQMFKDNGVELEAATLARPVRLLDALPSCANRAGPEANGGCTTACVCPELQCDRFELTPVRGKGVAERLGPGYQFEPGELVLADAGYCHAARHRRR